MGRSLRTGTLWLFVVALLACCSRGTGPGPMGMGPDAGGEMPDGGAGVFIALDEDFADYRSWPHFTLQGGGEATRTVYYKAQVPHGATAFPMGTMIVKEMESPSSPDGLEIDAMVKRGGGYNSLDGGAPGWEWFGLVHHDGGLPLIKWRGTGAPASGAYNGGGTSCTGCHATARDNDFVQSPPLQLTNF